MGKVIGVVAADRIAAGLVKGNRIVGAMRIYPEPASEGEGLHSVPANEIAALIRRQIELLAEGETVDAVGVGFAGIIREGLIEESPNLQQAKGFRLKDALAETSQAVLVLNDADAMAAGIAATADRLESVVRVWTLGEGIGFGRYPQTEGIGEGGHIVVTLDPKEKHCGCGGAGHLEGIMGHAAMRRRFLDLEPDEVFEAASKGDARCGAFVKMWHRALAAATATSVHLDGPGKFYITGPNARFADIGRLNLDLLEMVRMSSLQGTVFEVMPTNEEIAVVGAGVSADRARFAL